MKVLTARGEIEFDQLEVKDIVERKSGTIRLATEYRFDGELVRRELTPPRADVGLDLRYHVSMGDNHRKVVTEFFSGETFIGNDVTVNILRPFAGVPQIGKVG